MLRFPGYPAALLLQAVGSSMLKSGAPRPMRLAAQPEACMPAISRPCVKQARAKQTLLETLRSAVVAGANGSDKASVHLRSGMSCQKITSTFA